MDKTLTLERLLLMDGKAPVHLLRMCEACNKEGRYVVWVDRGKAEKYVYYIRCGCMTYYFINTKGRVEEKNVAVPRDVATYLALVWS